jgi:hypothetical protein
MGVAAVLVIGSSVKPVAGEPLDPCVQSTLDATRRERRAERAKRVEAERSAADRAKRVETPSHTKATSCAIRACGLSITSRQRLAIKNAIKRNMTR